MAVRNQRKSREERLSEIRKAAKKLFIEKGYQKTTMEDIVRLTALSKGGLYYYYSDKKEIMIDLMKSSNAFYMTYNDNIVKLKDELDFDKKKEILIDAILEKFLPVTDDKLLYTIFACEINTEKEFWDVFVELEASFFNWMEICLNIDFRDNIEKFKLVSRVINGLLITQNLFKEPEIFQNHRDVFKKFFSPLIDEIIK